MSRRPLVSVVTAACEGAAVLGRALDSVAAQGRRDVEVVVVDDASRDATAGVAAARGARVLRRRRRGGRAVARNQGVRAARGRFIALLDQDDFWKPGFLDAALGAFAPGVQVVSTNYDLVDDAGRVRLRRAIRPGRHLDAAVRALGLSYVPHHSSSVLRRCFFDRVGLYDESFGLLCEDADLWYRGLAVLGPRAFRLVDRSLACYRRSRPLLEMPAGRLSRPARLSRLEQAQALELAALLVKHRALLEGGRRGGAA